MIGATEPALAPAAPAAAATSPARMHFRPGLWPTLLLLALLPLFLSLADWQWQKQLRFYPPLVTAEMQRAMQEQPGKKELEYRQQPDQVLIDLYRRDYFASHPANVMVFRLTADRPGAYSGTIRLADAGSSRPRVANRWPPSTSSCAKKCKSSSNACKKSSASRLFM